ncbi:histidine kinase dimerization/phosphoacceptor domain -containing protein [Flavobacterium sp.]|uniref:histidine kinase dimerization/phosphoacceptor domain -containing protein n=1 Tax=Flavobacterium sp. TaxID=239 RepID=UPI0039E373B8
MHKITMLLLGLAFTSVGFAQSNPNIYKELHQKLRLAKDDATRIDAWLDLDAHFAELALRPENAQLLDSSLFYLTKAESLSEKIGYKRGIGGTYMSWSRYKANKGETKEAIEWANKSIDYFTKWGNKNDLGEAYMALAFALPQNCIPKDKFDALENASKNFKLGGKLKEAASALTEMGAWRMGIMGEMLPGMEHLEEALKIQKQIGYERTHLVDCYLAVGYNQMANYEKAIAHILSAIKTVEHLGVESAESAEVYHHGGRIYYSVGDLKTSYSYFEKAYQQYKKFDVFGQIIQVENNLILVSIKLKKEKEALFYMKGLEKKLGSLPPNYQITAVSNLLRGYTYFKDYKSAEKYSKKAMDFSAQFPENDMRQNVLYPALADYHFGAKQYDLARKYGEKYKLMSEKIKNAKAIAEIHRMFARIDSAQLRFDDALKHFKQEKMINDSLLSADKNRQIAQLKIEYETDKKDKDLAIKEKSNQLLKKQSELQQSRLLQTLQIKNISVGGIVLLVIILLLLYSGYRNKQKTNRILESQKNEINQKNSTLEKLVDEKEWLLKEIHHRVKNNLQMVMSLLNTQSHYLKDKAAMVAIRDSQHRIHSMSLIHKKLYQSDNVIAINMEVYICELIEYFKQSFDTGQRIRFVTDIQPIELDTSQAVPLGLIINEAITNAIKHAFPGQGEGTITVVLKQVSESTIELSIKDNGTGLPEKSVPSGNSSLGMKLINGLSSDLDAKLNIENDNGLRISMTFVQDRKTIQAQTQTLENIKAVS